MGIRAVIVDDEPLARERLRHLLRGVDDIEVVAEARDGATAVTTVRAAAPDLLFLDVQMPELDGFEVLRRLPPERWPAVVFVTAYDRYAIDAFEVHALDYLLKPVDRARFLRTLERVRAHLAAPDDQALSRRMAGLLAELEGRRAGGTERLAVRTGDRTVFVPVADIEWVGAADNYVRLHVGRQVHLMRETMYRMEQLLPADRFIRIHRSTIVNLDRIREVQPWFHGEQVVVLADGTKLTTGRSYRARLDELLRPGGGGTARKPPHPTTD